MGKKNYYKKKTYSKKPIMAKKPKDADQDKQIVTIKKELKKLQGEIDLKKIDSLLNGEFNTTATTTALLNPVVQGVSEITRIANNVLWTSIQVKGVFFTDPQRISAQTCRMIIFIDKAANGIAPTMAMLLNIGTITLPQYAPYNEDYFTRFKIIKDKLIVLNPSVVNITVAGVTTDAISKAQIINFRESLHLKANYGLSNFGDIRDISTGAVWIMLIGGFAAGTDCPSATLGIRMFFRDI